MALGRSKSQVESLKERGEQAVAQVGAAIVQIEAAIVQQGREQEVLRAEAADARFRRDVLGESTPDSERLYQKADEIGQEIARKQAELRRAKEYLATLHRPLREAELAAVENELMDLRPAGRERLEAVLAAARGLLDANEAFYDFTREFDEKRSQARRLRRELGRSDPEVPALQYPRRPLVPLAKLLTGAERSKRSYEIGREGFARDLGQWRHLQWDS